MITSRSLFYLLQFFFPLVYRNYDRFILSCMMHQSKEWQVYTSMVNYWKVINQYALYTATDFFCFHFNTSVLRFSYIGVLSLHWYTEMQNTSVQTKQNVCMFCPLHSSISIDSGITRPGPGCQICQLWQYGYYRLPLHQWLRTWWSCTWSDASTG